jgi:hypothetical protein
VTGESLSEPVRAFLSGRIDSVEQLEILLLLHQSPERSWRVEDVAAALYRHPDSIGRRLANLQLQGLLRRDDSAAYSYAPTAGFAPAVDAVAAAYRERRVSVVALIASRPMDNVRAFSEAFRVRKEEEP